MSGPYVERSGEAGGAAATDVEREIRSRIADPGSYLPRRSIGERLWGEEFETIPAWSAHAVVEFVAALVAAAEERGRVEGAAKAYRHIASEARLDGRLNPQWLENMARHAETGTRPGDPIPADGGSS